jgi:hypothetical protein
MEDMLTEFIHNVLPLVALLLAGIVGIIWSVIYK